MDEIQKQIEQWDPDKAKAQGTLKCDLDFRFDVSVSKIAPLQLSNPPIKKIENMKHTIVSVGKRNKGGLF